MTPLVLPSPITNGFVVTHLAGAGMFEQNMTNLQTERTTASMSSEPSLPSVASLSALLATLDSRHASWQLAQQLMAAQLAPNFSPFTVYRRREVDVSRHLALLLDPKGSHGQGSLFWDAWVEQVLQAQASQCFEKEHGQCEVQPASPTISEWLRSSKVRRIETEHRTTELEANRRAIDLCVHLTGGWLAIENKPWHESVHQENQLLDYTTHLRRLAGAATQEKAKSWMLVYLGHSLEEVGQSLPEDDYKELAKNGQFVCVTWEQLLAAMHQCLPKIQAAKVRWFVEDFIQMMERATMNYTDTAEMEHVAQAFNQTPQDFKNALSLRNNLKQWQASQLEKLHKQLTERCTPHMKLDWHIKTDAPSQKQAHFTLAFERHQNVLMRVEWFWGYGNESDFYWGLYAPDMDLSQAQALAEKLKQVNPALPFGEAVEGRWPFWAFFSADPLFRQNEASTSDVAEVIHPWLSVDRIGNDFVSLLLQRYRNLEAALDLSL